jgi:DNA topoisomerase-6 subunit A
MKRKRFQTLFDKNFSCDNSCSVNYPYSVAVNLLDDTDDVEIHAFQQVLEHEGWMYEPRGKMIGDINIYEHNHLAYSGADGCYEIPSWVEGDYCKFGDFAAHSIIVTTEFSAFDILQNAHVDKLLNTILVLTSGIPRFVARRFIHLLESHTRLPVFCLVDNDTWGYFAYSVLLRGCLAPHKKYAFDAIPNCHFIGLNAHQAEQCVAKDCPVRNWKPIWAKRIRALLSYDCFSSEQWQNEFKKFKNHGYAVNLDQALQYCGTEWLNDAITDWQLSTKNSIATGYENRTSR